VFHSPILAGVNEIDLTPNELRVTEDDNSRITEDGNFRVTSTGDPTYKIWRHETGLDEIDGQSINAILSYFETADISLLVSGDPKSAGILCKMIEPDFVQSGEMKVEIVGRINARAPNVTSPPRFFIADPEEPYQQQVFFKEQRREMRFRFESNTVGGDYQMGQVLAHIETGDGRYQS
jgi:hypothetical protein